MNTKQGGGQNGTKQNKQNQKIESANTSADVVTIKYCQKKIRGVILELWGGGLQLETFFFFFFFLRNSQKFGGNPSLPTAQI